MPLKSVAVCDTIRKPVLFLLKLDIEPSWFFGMAGNSGQLLVIQFSKINMFIVNCKNSCLLTKDSKLDEDLQLT